MIDIQQLQNRLRMPGRVVAGGVPQGLDALLLPQLARGPVGQPLLHVCTDDQRLALLAEQLAFFAPDMPLLRFPAWDRLPYDRVSPTALIISRRLATLASLAASRTSAAIVLTTVNAVLQRVVPRAQVTGSSFSATPGKRVDGNALTAFLASNGYSRTGTVVDPGDFALRGGIIDIFPPGAEMPCAWTSLETR